MRWPADHPAVTDPALAPWAEGADRVCPGAEVVRVLRHLPGRRVTTLVETADGPAVLKIFATSRARGAHRRLHALARSSAGDLVPRPLGHRKGRVLLVEFVEGEPLDRLGDEELVVAAAPAGRALRRLHGSGVVLDREWSVADEVAQLRRTAGRLTREAVERALESWTPPETAPLVPSHRDCHPAQVVRTADGVRFIDLDDSAMSPAALDVGNFVAHLWMDAVLERRSSGRTSEAVEAFLEGHGAVPDGLEAWCRLALVRLAALAETRHRSAPAARRLASAALHEAGPLQTATGAVR